MSARDDYPRIRRLAASGWVTGSETPELNAALDEIDRLRADLAGAELVTSAQSREIGRLRSLVHQVVVRLMNDDGDPIAVCVEREPRTEAMFTHPDGWEFNVAPAFDDELWWQIVEVSDALEAPAGVGHPQTPGTQP